jgi:hypothetical protein
LVILGFSNLYISKNPKITQRKDNNVNIIKNQLYCKLSNLIRRIVVKIFKNLLEKEFENKTNIATSKAYTSQRHNP